MGKNAGEKIAKQNRRDEEERQARVRAGTDSINRTFDTQFNDQFFDAQGRAFTDFARPQLDQQHNDAREKLIFALARDGTLDSSIRTEKDADLKRAYDREVTALTDRGREYSTNARNSVEDARANLISSLTVTGDNIGASNAALARAKALSSAPTYSPLEQLFTDFTASYAQKAAEERATALANGLTPGGGGATLFGGNRNSVKVS